MRKMLAVAAIAVAVATPATVVASGADKKPAPPAAAKVAKKKVPVVSLVFKGVVKADATAESVVISPVKGTNRHARVALKGASELMLKLTSTKLKGTVIKADGTKSTAIETYADLKAGDVVMFHVRAKKGTSLDNLPAAKWLRDFTGLVTPAPVPAPVA